MLNKKKILVAGVLVFALLAAGIGGVVVLAQSPTPTPNGKANFVQLFLQALASRLGTTTDKLTQAMTDARKDAINNAVTQGLITQAQANQMLQRLQNAPAGKAPFGFGFPGAPGKGPRPGFAMGAARGLMSPDVLEAVAKTLNMSPADLTTALRGGKTLADLAKSQNVDPTKVQQAIADAEKAAIDRAVTDGLMTQANANTLKAQIDPTKIDLTKPGLGFGFPGRGRFGPGWQKRPGNPSSPAPTPTPKSS